MFNYKSDRHKHKIQHHTDILLDALKWISNFYSNIKMPDNFVSSIFSSSTFKIGFLL